MSDFFLHCPSYGVKGESGNLAKGRKFLGPDPHLSMVTIRRMLRDHHNYRNSSNFMNTSST